MIFIMMLVGFLVIVTLSVVGLSLMGRGKGVKSYSLRDILKDKNN